MMAMSTSQDILLTAKAFTSTNGFIVWGRHQLYWTVSLWEMRQLHEMVQLWERHQLTLTVYWWEKVTILEFWRGPKKDMDTC